jgi:uncharacterized membrane protein (DUF106 family)
MIPLAATYFAGKAAVDYMQAPAKAANKQAEEAARRNAAAIQEVKDAQSSASTNAQESLMNRKRAMSRSQTIYTSPLGISGQATTARKTLLGQ